MAPQIIQINRFHYFRSDYALQRLNYHFRIHSDFMLHQISGTTGCSLDDAMKLLMLLYNFRVVNAYLVVYDKLDPETPIMTRELVAGLPVFPFKNPQTQLSINSMDELLFEFMFKLIDSSIRIEFTNQ